MIFTNQRLSNKYLFSRRVSQKANNVHYNSAELSDKLCGTQREKIFSILISPLPGG
jgi:hypothetical protein